MSDRLKELRARRAELIDSAHALFDKVDPKMGMTDEQKAEHDKIQADLSRIGASIEAAEAVAGLERSAPVVAETNPTPKPDAKPGFSSFGEQLQAIANAGMNRGASHDSRLVWQMAQGANEAVPSEGGFLVQSDFSTQMLNLMHEMGEILPRVRRIPIGANSNGIKLPAVDETSRVNGSRFGGVQAYWTNEGDTTTATKPKLREMDLRLNKLMGLGYATDELLADASALESIMRTAFVEELTFKAEDAVINGAGAGQPLGVLNSGALVTVAAESGQAAATIRTENVLNMWARMPARSKRNAVWYINQDVEPQLYQLTLGSGTAVTLLYTPPGVSGNNSPYGLLMGRPVIPVEYCATLGTVGDFLLIDPQQYVMIDKGGLTSAQSMHVRFIYDEMTFRFTFRVDGQPVWSNAVTPYQGANTLSPYVALATRA